MQVTTIQTSPAAGQPIASATVASATNQLDRAQVDLLLGERRGRGLEYSTFQSALEAARALSAGPAPAVGITFDTLYVGDDGSMYPRVYTLHAIGTKAPGTEQVVPLDAEHRWRDDHGVERFVQSVSWAAGTRLSAIVDGDALPFEAAEATS